MGKITKSIDRALQVLELFSFQSPEWGVTEISEELNLYKSNVHNILSTLENRGFVQKNPKTERYKLGSKVFELGSVYLKDIGIREVAQIYIEELSNKYNETVHLGVLDKKEVISIENEESSHPLSNHIFIGERAPLHATAVGKAILAHLPANKQQEIINEGLTKYTENTITEPEELKNEIKKIKERGYAIDNEEHQRGVRCVAAPIKNYKGKVESSLSISGPSARLPIDNLKEIGPEISKICEEISYKLGYSKTSENAFSDV